MEPLRELSDLWNWLPAFRAVAETQHLQRASAKLHVSPSALSRSIRLLEDAVGEPLFTRAGRNIVLNDAGETLLRGLRSGMRGIHEALQTVRERRFAGELRIATSGPTAQLLLGPALGRLLDLHPGLEPRLRTGDGNVDVPALLLRGDIDVAVLCDPQPAPSLTIRHIADLPISVYCALGHPFFGTQPSLERIQHASFVAPHRGLTSDGWPPELDRRVAVRAEGWQCAMVCLAGGLLAVFPDAFAAPRAEQLWRLQAPALAPISVYAMHRETLDAGGRAEALVEELLRR